MFPGHTLNHEKGTFRSRGTEDTVRRRRILFAHSAKGGPMGQKSSAPSVEILGLNSSAMAVRLLSGCFSFAVVSRQSKKITSLCLQGLGGENRILSIVRLYSYTLAYLRIHALSFRSLVYFLNFSFSYLDLLNKLYYLEKTIGHVVWNSCSRKRRWLKGSTLISNMRCKR